MLDPRIPITDHRGKRFALSSEARFLPESDLTKRERQRVAHRVGWRDVLTAVRRRLWWVAAGIGMFAILLALDLLVRPPVFRTAGSVLLLFSIFWISQAVLADRSTGICNALLHRSLCPSCGYHLNGLTPDPDLCTTCPECGAAWKLP